jgi:hypothetical protein
MARQLKLSYIIEATEGASGRVLDHIGSKLDAIGHSYAGLAAMVGGGLEIRASIDEDSYFRQLAALTDTSFEKLEKIKTHIHSVASDSKIKIDEMTEGLAAFQRSGGTFAEFDRSANSAADAIAVLGGKGEEVGRVMAALDRSFDIKGPDKLRDGLALVVTELGAVNADFHSFAQSFPELAEDYAAQGFKGFEAERDLVATFGTLQMTSRSPRQAFGAVKELLEDLGTDPRRVAFTSHTAIAVGDASGHMLPLSQMIGNIASAYASGDRGRRWLIEQSSGLSQEGLFALQGFTTPEGRKTLAQMESTASTPAGLDKLAARMHENAELATSGIGASLQKVLDRLEQKSDWLVEHVLDPLAGALDRNADAAADLVGALGVGAGGSGLLWGLKELGSVLGLVGDNAGKAARAAPIAEGAGAGAAEGAAAVAGTTLAGAVAAGAALGVATGLGNYYANKALDEASGGEIDPYGGPIDPTVGIPFWSLRHPSRWFGHGSEIPGVPDIHAVEDRSGAGATRGIRNNNPLNLEFHSGQGAVRSDGRFGVFDTMEHGIEAEYRQLLRYGDRGLDSVDKIVRTWAPASENDDAAYEREVLKGSKIGANDRLDLRDAATASWLMTAMARHESGARLDPAVIHRAIASVAKVGGEIVIKVEAADGTKARVTSVKSSNPDLALSYGMGIGMVAP